MPKIKYISSREIEDLANRVKLAETLTMLDKLFHGSMSVDNFTTEFYLSSENPGKKK